MSAAPIKILVHLKHNTDGTLRTTNPLGDFVGQQQTRLAVDQQALANALPDLTTGRIGQSALSFNLRGPWLTGTEAGTCSFSLRTVAGSDAASHNWSIAGATLSQSYVSASAGSGTLELVATDSTGKQYVMGDFGWNITTSSALFFFPGVYVFLGGVGQMGGRAVSDALTRMDALVALDTTDSIQGFEVMPHWSALVNGSNHLDFSGGWDTTNNSGFAGMTQLVNRAKSYTPPRRMTMTIYQSTPSGSTSRFPGIAPAFLNSSAYGTVDGSGGFGGAYSNTGISMVRFWNLAVANELVNTCKGYVTEYGSDVFRIDPFAEISPAAETGYTDSGFSNTFASVAPAMRAQCPQTDFLIRFTFPADNTFQHPVIQAAVAAHWSWGVFDGMAEPPVSRGKYIGSGVAYRGFKLNYTVPNTITDETGNGWLNYVGGLNYWFCIQEDELGPENPTAHTLPAHEGSGDMNEQLAEVNLQGACYVVYWDDDGVTGPTQNETTSVHPNLIDFWAAATLPSAYPTLWPA